jgi:serine protease
MFPPRNRQVKRPHRPLRQPLTLEVLEDRTLLSTSPTTTLLDLNGLTVNPNQYSSTDILVQFQGTPGTPGGPAVAAGTTLGAQLPLETGFYQVNLDPGMTVAKALAAYQAEKGVLNAEPDYQLSVSSVPNDPLFTSQWALNNTGQGGGTPGDDINAEEAWSVTTGSRNIVVAVLDTGVDYDDTDLAENIWINQADIPDYWYTKTSATSGYDKIVYKSEIKTATPGIITMADLNNPANAGLVWKSDGDSLVDAGDLLRPLSEGGWEKPGAANAIIGWNYVNNNNNPMDENGHGTNVAGILGAVGNNGTGVAGVDWNVQIMPVEFMGADGEGSVSSFIEALNFAVQHGAKITNNSWEGAPYSTALYDAFQNAKAHGVICVAAAGNEASNDDTTPDYPASLSTSLNNVVTVAATTNTNQLASFSNYGVHSVDLAAPGVNILSTLPDNQYGEMSGTSMATPEVAGAMALVWSLHPSWSYTQVIDQVLDTTTKLPSLEGKVKTGGLLNLAGAVGYRSSVSPAASPAASPAPRITSVSDKGPTSTSMDSITLTFNEAINPSSFSSSAVTLTNANGTKIPVTVKAVAGSNDKEFQLLFSNQTLAGDYHLSISSSVRSSKGAAMAPYKTTITLSTSHTYSSATGKAIKAKSLTLSSITLPAGTTIGNLEVRVDVDFPVDDNLEIYLISPSGKTIVLDNEQGGSGANLSYTVFTEQTSRTMAAGKAPFSGAYLPKQSLNQLIGSSSGGTWQLAIRNYGSRSGTLLNWSLIVTPGAAATKTSSTATTSTAKTYSHTTRTAITSRGLAISSINVPAGTTIGNLEVRVDVDFPVDGNLYIYLISPSGKTIVLDNEQGSGADLSYTVFTEQTSRTMAAGKAPYSGAYLPYQSLDQLIGSSSGGTWRLAIRNYGTHTGTLLNWSLILTPRVSTSSVKASSVEAPVSAASTSSPSAVVSSLSTTGGQASPISVAANTNDAPPLPALASGANNAPSRPAAVIDQLVTSTRAWSQFLTSWLIGQDSRQDRIGVSGT